MRIQQKLSAVDFFFVLKLADYHDDYWCADTRAKSKQATN